MVFRAQTFLSGTTFAPPISAGLLFLLEAAYSTILYKKGKEELLVGKAKHEIVESLKEKPVPPNGSYAL